MTIAELWFAQTSGQARLSAGPQLRSAWSVIHFLTGLCFDAKYRVPPGGAETLPFLCLIRVASSAACVAFRRGLQADESSAKVMDRERTS